ncbi:uncharacterized protein GGS22DRAFT_87178 [Annulohypoxylon maeteangense]|uniref:uncharacterized protein n=1 Tax=Annulohypoxylon maeteangense TaxID=1927788 RepID=UPI002008E59B|nr:uncharacterized protein GGS22DRAFT_87178 [Annulohypoxylon maeteangense]KAI0880224.1 hypothetical protein GGS22DRAFT_87178 [Annulohypoxylon maeteangense]
MSSDLILDQPQDGYASTSSNNFVWISDSNSSRKLIKAHVSRNSHAKARRKRMIEYQHITIQQGQQEQGSRALFELDFRKLDPPYFTLIADGVGQHYGSSNTSVYYPSIISSLSDPTSEFESYLLNYYIHSIIKHRTEDHYVSYEHIALQEWFPVAVAHPGMRMGLLLCASKSLYVRTGASRYHQCALRYKASCLRMLGDAVKAVIGTTKSPAFTSRVEDSTISIALQLASDEFAAGNSIAWESHINAVYEMVKLNGGLDTIKGMNGFLRVMIEVMTSKHLHGMILTASSDVNDVSKLYKLEYFFRGTTSMSR